MEEKNIKKEAVKDSTKTTGDISLEQIKKMNLFEKMMRITSEMPIIEKKMEVNASSTRTYKAVGELDVLNAVKPLEEKYRVWSYPCKREKELFEIPRREGVFIRISSVYRFVNIDNPTEFIDIDSYGDGIDSMDKAPGKAMTYADKYALMKAYKISTGDDPDAEGSADLEKELKKASEPKKAKAASPNLNAPATKEQLDAIVKHMAKERIPAMLGYYKHNDMSEMTYGEASEAIRKLKEEGAAARAAKVPAQTQA